MKLWGRLAFVKIFSFCTSLETHGQIVGERESVNWRISSRHFFPPVYTFPRASPLSCPRVSEDAFCIFVCSFLQGCVPLGWSGSVSVIRDHSDHGRSNEPMNPLWTRIHWFIWPTMIQMISDHWFWSGSYQRNAPQDLPVELELKVRSIGMIRVRTIIVIRDHSDHSTSKELTNPPWEMIHRYLRCSMVRVISDHWSWSGSFQRNASLHLKLKLVMWRIFSLLCYIHFKRKAPFRRPLLVVK